MLRVAAILALVTADSAAAAAPIPVTVTSAAQEQQARRLDSALRKELARDGRFALVDHQAPGALNIALPAGTGWERRLDWTEIFFQARLNSASGRSQVITGRCYNWNMPVCAKQILDAAAQFAAS